MTERFYEIGGVKFSVETPVEFEEREPYSLFTAENIGSTDECDVRYVFSFADTLPKPCGELLFEDSNYRAYADGNTIKRYIGFYHNGKECDPPFALVTYPEEGSNIYSVQIPLDRDVPLKSSIVYRTLCFEHMLVDNGGVALHSSLVETKYGAILFTAPSGTGKSTQGELWRKYRGADVINGDCSLIRRDGEKLYAWGLPYSGTSGICFNRRAELKAIVYLGQAPQNTVSRLKGSAAFRHVLEGIKVNLWNKLDAEKASDLIMSIVSEIPIFRLDCVPDESAVAALENEIVKL